MGKIIRAEIYICNMTKVTISHIKAGRPDCIRTTAAGSSLPTYSPAMNDNLSVVMTATFSSEERVLRAVLQERRFLVLRKIGRVIIKKISA